MKKVGALLIVLFAVLACQSSSVVDQLPGKWKTDLKGNEFVLKFGADGTCIPYRNGKEMPAEYHGKWQVLEDGTVSVDYGKSGISTGHINEAGALVLSAPKGSKFKGESVFQKSGE